MRMAFGNFARWKARFDEYNAVARQGRMIGWAATGGDQNSVGGDGAILPLKADGMAVKQRCPRG